MEAWGTPPWRNPLAMKGLSCITPCGQKFDRGPPLGRGYIPKAFAFENPYPLNPKESDLFYFLLIRTKRPKSTKFQRAVSSSSELHAIQCIPRGTTTLAFLLIIRRKADTRDMRKSLHIVPSVGFSTNYQEEGEGCGVPGDALDGMEFI